MVPKNIPGLAATQPAPTLWTNANFILLLLAGEILAVGNKIYELALPLILYEQTHSSVAMSTMRGIEFLPNLLFAAFIGVLVDRVRKKAWSLWAVALQIVILVGLYMGAARGHHSEALYYCGGFLLMLFGYAYANARVALVKQALPTASLTKANASFTFVTTLVGIMGPVLTGLILLLTDLHDGLLLTAGSFVAAFLLLLSFNPKRLSTCIAEQDSGPSLQRAGDGSGAAARCGR
ncbi:hypothetical protein FHS18_002367 [Paenibacillus phyllosphaerae]|uniref:Uncharacterized protein n=1 Tax=Paenibacillus phyllosphaerae TaxID=274593 RepID=A0A7W5AWX1_9BACL|nr:MFS transporter [Paenibacillus phyllosphaerae]MBB3110300.1 hypothetical protein [Paenibacillus phyllosphaerae]